MQSPVRAGIEPLKDAESASSSLTIVVHDRSRSGGPSDVRPTNQALAGLRLLVAYRRDLVGPVLVVGE